MELRELTTILSGNSYPGRGIAVGLSEDGRHAAAVYFIMGRSSNSRNRIFAEDGQGLRTQAYDLSRLEDPSLIIYAPVRVLGQRTIVTNGDQTDTIFRGLQEGKTFEQCLRTREFEPDAPNYTPRISALLDVSGGIFAYQMSILKSADMDPSSCSRHTFSYQPSRPGEGHFLHTYMGDGNPLPSFEGEPVRVALRGDLDTLTRDIWNSLNEENRVSLFVRMIDLADASCSSRIVNRNR